MKLTREQKREIIKLWNEGYGSIIIGRKIGVSNRTIERITQTYKIHGEKIFEEKKCNREYSPELKLSIMRRIETGETVNAVANEYMIDDGLIHSWIKKYDEFGYNGLVRKQRGRPRMKREKADNEISIKERIELRELRKRNKQLEMENELLKKLDALVQERIKQEKEKK